MDLEGFDDAIGPNNNSLQNLSFLQVLDFIDNEWYIKASRSARWMDLLGDYAGSEPFVIDGKLPGLFPIRLSPTQIIQEMHSFKSSSMTPCSQLDVTVGYISLGAYLGC